MHEFARRYRLLRDGNQLPGESWKSKKISANPDKFFLGFVVDFESVTQEMLEEAMLASAESGTTYAEFHFRYQTSSSAVQAADRYLNEFFFPLQEAKVIGRAVPVIPEGGEGRWFLMLFNERDIPSQFLVTLTPLELFDMVTNPRSYLERKVKH